MENILTAPGNKTVFMSGTSLYYNDRGRHTLNKKGFTGTCALNCGSILNIENGKIVSVNIIDNLLQDLNYPNCTLGELTEAYTKFLKKSPLTYLVLLIDDEQYLNWFSMEPLNPFELEQLNKQVSNFRVDFYFKGIKFDINR
jgi:hypothetical protein